MITLPDDVKQDDNWAGTSTDLNTGSTVSNKETAMSWPEHQRIVCAARALLQTMDFPQDEQDENLAKKALMRLREVYTTVSDGVLYVTKGIHQPYSNPHIQLKLALGGKAYLYHLDVSAHEVVTDREKKEHFHWRGVRFSARLKNGQPSGAAEQYDYAEWPLGVVVTPKVHRPRRDSISEPSLLKLNRKLVEEEERRRQQSDLDRKKKALLETVSLKLKLKPKRPADVGKLFVGGTVTFLTEKKKEISCTYDGTHFVHSDGQKMRI